MIIGSVKNNIVEVVGEKSSTATINTNKIGKLAYLLTEGLYSDAKSAVIVELANNGVDAIIESGKDPIENPVIVELGNDGGAYFIKISDKGIGMSKEFFENFFMSLLSSTKEDSNEYIGAFGIGGKAWLSLQRNVTFTIRKDGVECKYLCYKGEELIDYDLIYEESTEEENGVIFEMPITDWREYEEFKEKAMQKLSYYDTVALVLNGEVWENKIYRNTLFQYTKNPPFATMHLCLKDVLYPIDWGKLGIPSIYVPIAIRFGLSDGIAVTPSRESILYGRETVELIKSKIGEIADYFKTLWNEQIKEPVRFYDYYDKVNSSNKPVALDGWLFETSGLSNYGKLQFSDFTIEGMELKPASWYKSKIYELLGHWEQKAEYNNNGIWKTKRLYTTPEYKFSSKKQWILVDCNLTGNVKEYLKETLGTGQVFVGTAKYRETLAWYKRNILGSVNKEDWRAHIIEWQGIIKQIKEDWLIDYSNVESSKEYLEWLEKRKEWLKANRERRASTSTGLNKQENDVTIAFARPTEIGKGYMFERKAYNIKNLLKTPHLVILVDGSQIEEGKALASLLIKEKVALIGVRELKKIEHIKQFIKMEEYLGDNKPFRRLATARIAEKVLQNYEKILGRQEAIIANCLAPLEKDVKTLIKYRNDNQRYGVGDDIWKPIEDVASTYNLYDEEVMPLIRHVNEKINVFSFLKYIETPRSWDEEKKKEISSFINQMLLFKKKFANELENYELVLKPVLAVEEPAF